MIGCRDMIRQLDAVADTCLSDATLDVDRPANQPLFLCLPGHQPILSSSLNPDPAGELSIGFALSCRRHCARRRHLDLMRLGLALPTPNNERIDHTHHAECALYALCFRP